MSKLENVDEIISIVGKLGVMGLIVVKFKRIMEILKEIFFGKEGYDFKELLGVVGLGGFIGMLIKHFTDINYVINEPLLYACLGISFSIAGLKGGMGALNKYLDNNAGNNNKE